MCREGKSKSYSVKKFKRNAFLSFFSAYEEQELTMTVFSDQDNSVISGNGQAHSTPQNIPGGNHHHLLGSRNGSISRASHLAGYDTQSNAYATINKVPISLGRRSLFNGSLGFVDGVPTNQVS